jgi:hypothetical protein
VGLNVADLHPDIWLWWRLDKTDGNTVTYEWSLRPLADQDSFKEPRLRHVGTIRRAASSDDGDAIVSTCEVDLYDDDGVVRGILADPLTRHGIGGEIAIRILSETARKAGATPSELMRGSVGTLDATGSRSARLKIVGTVGGLMSEANEKKTFPQQRIGDEHTYAPQTSKGLVYPLYIGIFSDVGAEDADGNSVEKGMNPLIDLGNVLLLADGTEVDQAASPIPFLDSPTNLDATVNGTAGEQAVVYEVTALSGYGETLSAFLTVETAPDLINGTDSVDLAWDAVDGAAGYHVYRNAQRLALVTDAEYTDVGAATTLQAPPTTNTAATDVETTSGTASPYMRALAAGKAVHVEHVYGSNLADGEAPTRTRLVSNTDYFKYGDADYPHATPYRDHGGIRQTWVYLPLGPIVAHHRSGSVTLAWNGWGVDTVGDLSGSTITQAFPGLEWLLNEEVLKDGGVGYKTGTYGPAETYANGVPMLKGSKFTEAQTLSARFMRDSVGYPVQIALTEPTPLRTILRRFHTTFASIDGDNRLGQWYPILINEYTNSAALSNNLSPLQDEATMSGNLGDETAGTALALLSDEQRAYRENQHITRWTGQEYQHGKVETRIVFNGGWDADAQAPLFEAREIAYDPATYGHADPKQRTTRQAPYCNDLAALSDAQDRYLRRHLIAPRKMGYGAGFAPGLEDDIGTEILLTHREGSSSASGDVNRRGLILEHTADANPPEEVTHRVLDLETIVLASAVSFGELQDETTMASGNLKDETSTRMPPVGAWRLR